MKKIIIVLIIIILLMTALIGCNNQIKKSDETDNYYIVTFVAPVDITDIYVYGYGWIVRYIFVNGVAVDKCITTRTSEVCIMFFKPDNVQRPEELKIVYYGLESKNDGEFIHKVRKYNG